MRGEREYLIYRILSGLSDVSGERYRTIEEQVELASTDALRRINGGGEWANFARVWGLIL